MAIDVGTGIVAESVNETWQKFDTCWWIMIMTNALRIHEILALCEILR